MEFKIYFLLFICYSLCGWIMEIISVYLRSKKLVNRGFLFGPYCSIYGIGALSMIFLLGSINNLLLLFILSFIVCGLIEYFISYLMEKIFRARWWDYSNRKFNINGRFCLENGIYFGLFGTILVKIINPFTQLFISSIPEYIINMVLIILSIIFIIDNLISFYLALKLKKIIKFSRNDNTNEIIALREKLLFRKI